MEHTSFHLLTDRQMDGQQAYHYIAAFPIKSVIH